MVFLSPWRITIVTITALFSLQVYAQSVPVLFEKPPSVMSSHNIQLFTEYFDDVGTVEVGFEDVKKKPFQPLSLRGNDRAEGLDNVKTVTWLRFSILNSLPDTLSLLYNCNLHYAIDFYSENSLVEHYGLFDRAVSRELPVLNIPPGQTRQYWVKITNYVQSVLPIASELYTRQAYLEVERKESARSMPLLIFCAAVLGCFFYMCVFAFYHFYLNRDKAFLFYGLSVLILFHSALMLINNRFGVFYWSNHSFIYMYFVMYILFVDKMIDINKLSPRGSKLVLAIIAVLVVLQCIHLLEYLVFHEPIISHNLFYKLQLMPGIVAVFVGAWFVYKSSSKLKNYLMTGMFAMLLLGFTPMWINAYVTMPYTVLETFVNFPPAWLALGLVIENISFGMALAYRSHLSEEEKRSIQQHYAANLNNELSLRIGEIEQKSRELEDQKVKQLTAEFEQQLKSIEMSALRAQMNPHFLFNCLNSIKLYTLENNSAMAAEYLTSFSRLMRLVLENSQHEKITLANELETLRLYIDMESMRFKNKFTYVEEVSEEIDVDYIEIPPMLLQPYVENAIWHGLMHKEHPGNLMLSVSQPNEHVIQVEITDDGVGRHRAAIFKSKSATVHKSAGLKLTSDRISLLNKRTKNETVVKIEDLVDPEGVPAGTRVTVNIQL